MRLYASLDRDLALSDPGAQGAQVVVWKQLYAQLIQTSSLRATELALALKLGNLPSPSCPELRQGVTGLRFPCSAGGWPGAVGLWPCELTATPAGGDRLMASDEPMIPSSGRHERNVPTARALSPSTARLPHICSACRRIREGIPTGTSSFALLRRAAPHTSMLASFNAELRYPAGAGVYPAGAGVDLSGSWLTLYGMAQGLEIQIYPSSRQLMYLSCASGLVVLSAIRGLWICPCRYTPAVAGRSLLHQLL